MKKYDISIIVPVYNTEKYLKRCIESILNQTYQDIEIIIINDCSPDHAEVIISDYSAKDNRIKYFKNKKNKGIGAVRNLGIKEAKGKYLLFVDSDDWIDLNACEILYNIAEKHQLEILEGDFIYFSKQTTKINPDIDYKNINIYHGLEYLDIHEFNASVNNRFWLKSFIQKNNLQFCIGRYYEEYELVIPGLFKTKRIAKINYQFYYIYDLNMASVTRQPSKNKHIHDKIILLNSLKKMYEDYKGTPYDKHFLIILAKQIPISLRYIRNLKGGNKTLKKTLLKQISGIIKDTRPVLNKVKSLSFKKRILIIISPKLYNIAFNIHKKLKKTF